MRNSWNVNVLRALRALVICGIRENERLGAFVDVTFLVSEFFHGIGRIGKFGKKFSTFRLREHNPASHPLRGGYADSLLEPNAAPAMR